jgi:predicted transcriptional regulator
MTRYDCCMTMLSFRVEEAEARRAQAWAERQGIDRSELLRDALRQHLTRLGSEVDAETWERQPFTDEEHSLATIGNWGPAEDWADWADAAR